MDEFTQPIRRADSPKGNTAKGVPCKIEPVVGRTPVEFSPATNKGIPKVEQKIIRKYKKKEVINPNREKRDPPPEITLVCALCSTPCKVIANSANTMNGYEHICRRCRRK